GCSLFEAARRPRGILGLRYRRGPVMHHRSMALRFHWFLAAAFFACRSNSSPNAPAAVPAQLGVSEDELQSFLKGMLVTSNVKPPDEPTWPEDGTRLMLGWLMPSLERRWGLKTPQEIREYIKE